MHDENPSLNTDNFAGWMGRLIARYKKISPDEKFFLMTMPLEHESQDEKRLAQGQLTKNDWSKQMSSFLLKANIDRKVLIEQELTSFPDDDIAEMEAEYDRILALGMEQNKGTKPQWAKKDEKKLLNRLRKYKPNHLLFLHRFDVSFDNNLSERDLRKCKNRQKMSGGFRTQEGCSMFCGILSVIETAKRQNVSPFEAIGKVLAGEALFVIPIRGGEQ